MIFYLDTEFNGFGGDLLTLALVPEDPNVPELYLARNDLSVLKLEPWVRDNVLPIVDLSNAKPTYTAPSFFSGYIQACLKRYKEVTIVADWPDDIRYLMMCLITGPGMMVDLASLNICLRRCEPWPNDLKDQVQHNALCDARALRNLFI